MSKYARWTSKDLDRLREGYERGELIKCIAHELGRSYAATRAVARGLGMQHTSAPGKRGAGTLVSAVIPNSLFSPLYKLAQASNMSVSRYLKNIIKDHLAGVNNDARIDEYPTRVARPEAVDRVESGEAS